MPIISFKPQWVTQDIDIRMIYTSIPFTMKRTHAHFENYVNGFAYLSQVGLHLYIISSQFSRGNWDRYTSLNDRATNFHIPFFDIKDAKQWPIYLPLGPVEYTPIYGYQSGGSSGMGKIVSGVKHLSSFKQRQLFSDLVIETSQKAPPNPGLSNMHPLLLRMKYFQQHQVIGGALRFADMILNLSLLQPQLQRGPGFFERGKFRSAGWDPNQPFYPIDSATITQVRHERAWMMIDSRRYSDIIPPSSIFSSLSKEQDPDPVVQLTYAMATVLNDAKKQKTQTALYHFAQAEAGAPDDLRVRAGVAWRLALQGRAQQAIDIVQSITPEAAKDRIALMILAYASKEVDRNDLIINLCMQALPLIHGYFGGAAIIDLLLGAALASSPATFMNIFEQVTSSLPQQREPWEFIIAFGHILKDENLIHLAGSKLLAMLNGIS